MENNGYTKAQIEHMGESLAKLEKRFDKIDNKLFVMCILFAAVAGEAGVNLMAKFIGG